MRLYNIDEEDITSGIESPDYSGREGKRNIAAKHFSGRFEGFPLKIVYTKRKQGIEVITAYPLKRKRWR